MTDDITKVIPEREARVRHLLTWLRTYHGLVNGMSVVVADVEAILAETANARPATATTPDQQPRRWACDACGVIVGPLIGHANLGYHGMAKIQSDGTWKSCDGTFRPIDDPAPQPEPPRDA